MSALLPVANIKVTVEVEVSNDLAELIVAVFDSNLTLAENARLIYRTKVAMIIEAYSKLAKDSKEFIAAHKLFPKQRDPTSIQGFLVNAILHLGVPKQVQEGLARKYTARKKV